MSTTPLFLASADGHVGLRTDLYRPYLEQANHADLDEFLQVHKFRWSTEKPESILAPHVWDRMKGNPRFEAGGIESLHDPVRRLAELDHDGIAVEVLFPDDQHVNTPPWLAGMAPIGLDRDYPHPLRLAGARAYNRWLVEFCATAPDRLLGVIVIASLKDVDAAIAEMRRAYESGLRHAVLLPLDYYLPLYHHPRYEPFWAACSELDLAVAIHLSDGGPDWYGNNGWAPAIYVIEALFYSQRPLWSLIFGGVLERYPNLRLVFTEQGADWVPGVLGLMDSLVQGHDGRPSSFCASIEEPLPLLPSEYFRRQCFVADSTMTRRPIEMRHYIGVSQMLWGSDFPHQEGMWPYNHRAIRSLFEGVPADEAAAILGENFLRAYKLDPAIYAPLVARIGPTIQDLIGVA
jgi:predicted TIM-barrel fold metal-dependent hydrolase